MTKTASRGPALNWTIQPPWHQQHDNSICIFINYKEKLFSLTFIKGNKVFDLNRDSQSKIGKLLTTLEH